MSTAKPSSPNLHGSFGLSLWGLMMMMMMMITIWKPKRFLHEMRFVWNEKGHLNGESWNLMRKIRRKLNTRCDVARSNVCACIYLPTTTCNCFHSFMMRNQGLLTHKTQKLILASVYLCAPAFPPGVWAALCFAPLMDKGRKVWDEAKYQ